MKTISKKKICQSQIKVGFSVWLIIGWLVLLYISTIQEYHNQQWRLGRIVRLGLGRYRGLNFDISKIFEILI